MHWSGVVVLAAGRRERARDLSREGRRAEILPQKEDGSGRRAEGPTERKRERERDRQRGVSE